MLREKIQKTKIAVFLLMVASIMSMSFTEVRAEDVLYLLRYEMEYKLDRETKTAEANDYMLKNDPMYTEFEIPSKIECNDEEYTVISIRKGAFAEAAYLEKVTIPSTVTTIGEEAFYKCSKLEKVQLPSSVTEIGDKAFQLCTSLKEIKLPSGLKKIPEAMLYGCESLETIEIPATVTVIEPASFFGCTKLKKVVIPDGVTELGECSFYGCTGLEEVVIPNSVKTIGEAVFLNCGALTELVIPESVEYVPSSVLVNCDNLERIIYPSGVKESFLIEEYETQLQLSYSINSDGTVSVTVENIPEGMTEVDLPADVGGRKITSITGAEGADVSVSCTNHYTKTYTKSEECHQYTCMVCKKTIKEAHNYAGNSQACVCGYVPFAITAQPTGKTLAYGKNARLSVAVKATLGKETISYQWHENGKMIAGAKTSVYEIPKRKPVGTYTYTCKITSGSYSKVTKAATVTVKAPAKGSKYKDDTNMATYKVTKARIDGKGTAEYAKPVNKKKSTVVIPATVKIGGITYKVTSIAKNAFKGNKNLKRLTIEKNVEKIGVRAFYGCKKLKTITIKTTKLKTKKIGANAFKNIKSKATVKVPKKKYKAYKTMLLKKGMSSKVKFRKY